MKKLLMVLSKLILALLMSSSFMIYNSIRNPDPADFRLVMDTVTIFLLTYLIIKDNKNIVYINSNNSNTSKE